MRDSYGFYTYAKMIVHGGNDKTGPRTMLHEASNCTTSNDTTQTIGTMEFRFGRFCQIKLDVVVVKFGYRFGNGVSLFTFFMTALRPLITAYG